MPPLGEPWGEVEPFGRRTVTATGDGAFATRPIETLSMTPTSLPARLDCRSAAVSSTPPRSRANAVEWWYRSLQGTAVGLKIRDRRRPTTAAPVIRTAAALNTMTLASGIFMAWPSRWAWLAE